MLKCYDFLLFVCEKLDHQVSAVHCLLWLMPVFQDLTKSVCIGGKGTCRPERVNQKMSFSLVTWCPALRLIISQLNDNSNMIDFFFIPSKKWTWTFPIVLQWFPSVLRKKIPAPSHGTGHVIINNSLFFVAKFLRPVSLEPWFKVSHICKYAS